MRNISFAVDGDCDDIPWDPHEWVDADSLESFEQVLLACAKDNATWGLKVISDRIEDLWAEVQKAKIEADQS